jgi:gliding motility-associated-like protein
MGTHKVSIVAFGAGGKRSQPKEIAINIVFRQPPKFDIIPDRDIALNDNSSITVYPEDVLMNVSNNDGIPLLFNDNGKNFENMTFGCDSIGSYTVSIFTNAKGCTYMQPEEVTFSISDQTPPVARCKPAVIYLVGNKKSTLTPTMINYGSTDNCEIASLQIKKTKDNDELYAYSVDFDMNDLKESDSGNISVMLRAVDASENEATCTANIRLIYDLKDIPGIFTPNGDGFNDTWDIQDIDKFPEATISIYNRAQKLMVELKGAQMPWDGRDQNGNLLESGYYLYRIVLRWDKIIAGHVTILR